MIDKDRCADMSPAARRYARTFLPAMLAYALAVVALSHVVRQLHPPAWASIPLALVPMAPLLLALRAYLVFFRAMDELQRRIQSEAMLIAMGLVGFGSLAYGFLEGFADFPRLQVIFVFPAMILVWGLATGIVARRYR
ncbi:MAG: hypothetical protein JNJ73_04245 [Hyphomonadaceae bacterium]|nr:hypothetical protein [Hyphomonadaceae bacterium]